MLKNVSKALNWSVKTYEYHSKEFINYARKHEDCLDSDALKSLETSESLAQLSDLGCDLCKRDIYNYKRSMLIFKLCLLCILSIIEPKYVYEIGSLVLSILIIYDAVLLLSIRFLVLLYKTRLLRLCTKRTVALFLEEGLLE